MNAVTYEGGGKVKVSNLPKPTLHSQEDAIIHVTTAAICGSDLHILHGILPVDPGTVIGHEFVGVVEEIGSDVYNVKPGDRVLSMAGVNCGRCLPCKKNMVWACENGGIYGNGPMFGNIPGAQAEYVCARFADETLTKIPDGLDDEKVLFAGDILATAYTGFTGVNPDGRKGIQPGKTVAIYGAGPVGLCCVAVARVYGASKIISVDLLDNRLEKAASMGADLIINAQKQDPVAAIMEATNGLGADFIVEAAGSPEALQNCVKSTALCGTVAILGIVPKAIELNFQQLIPKNLTIEAGICNGIHTDKLIRLIQSGQLDVSSMITHRFQLAEAEEAYRLFEKKLDGAIKMILKP
jgi:alcohol dehydrogenase